MDIHGYPYKAFCPIYGMPQVWSSHIQKRLKEIDDFLLAKYKRIKKRERKGKKRNWKTYEQQLAFRIKEAMKNLEPLISEAVSSIRVSEGRGRKPKLSVKQRVTLLMLKRLFGKSNRNMACMLAIFSILSQVDVSYKIIEHLYSDPEVELAIYNLHVLVLKKKGVKNADTSGDGTGYSLTIRKHYASVVEKRKDKAKSAPKDTKNQKKKKKKKLFVYSFKLLALKTRMYIAYGTSMKSEKDAFDKAMNMLADIDITVNSARLDRYYSCPSYVDRLGGAKVYVIPKKNSTLRGSWKWKRTMKNFVTDTLPYLGEYYLRNNSESEISVDKRWLGWKIEQRRDDRIETAIACGNVWHNLFRLYEKPG